METPYQIISAAIGLGIVLMIAPRILARNHGKILRNIAIWIGLFLLLALLYKNLHRTQPSVETTRVTNDLPTASVEIEPDAASNELSTPKENDDFSPPQE